MWPSNESNNVFERSFLWMFSYVFRSSGLAWRGEEVSPPWGRGSVWDPGVICLVRCGGVEGRRGPEESSSLFCKWRGDWVVSSIQLRVLV